MAEGPWPRALVATAPWRASYADPIRLWAGDPIHLTGREDIWEGHRWVWAVAPDGREGWVPDALVVAGRAEAVYSAMELDCAPGDRLTATRALHGWVWCRDTAGAEGWVPARCLALQDGAKPPDPKEKVRRGG